MKKIILKTEYPWCSSDDYIEVNDEIADVFTQYKRSEKAYKEKIRYYKAYYSLDEDNGTSKSILFVSASPDELFEKNYQTKNYIRLSVYFLKSRQIEFMHAFFRNLK